jgi:hypothetical protein
MDNVQDCSYGDESASEQDEHKLRDIKVIYQSNPPPKVHSTSCRPTLRVLARSGSRGYSFYLTDALSFAESEELIGKLPSLAFQSNL